MAEFDDTPAPRAATPGLERLSPAVAEDAAAKAAEDDFQVSGVKKCKTKSPCVI